jgi:hypothetical protein
MGLAKVSSDDLDDFFSRPLLFSGRLVLRVEDVKTNMALHNFGHEGINRAPTRRDCEKDIRTILVPFQGFLDGVDLTPQTPDPVQKFRFGLYGVCHTSNQ